MLRSLGLQWTVVACSKSDHLDGNGMNVTQIISVANALGAWGQIGANTTNFVQSSLQYEGLLGAQCHLYMLGPFRKVPDRVTGAICHALVQCVAPWGSQLYQNQNPIGQLLAGALAFGSPPTRVCWPCLHRPVPQPQNLGCLLYEPIFPKLHSGAPWAVFDHTASPSGPSPVFPFSPLCPPLPCLSLPSSFSWTSPRIFLAFLESLTSNNPLSSHSSLLLIYLTLVSVSFLLFSFLSHHASISLSISSASACHPVWSCLGSWLNQTASLSAGLKTRILWVIISPMQPRKLSVRACPGAAPALTKPACTAACQQGCTLWACSTWVPLPEVGPESTSKHHGLAPRTLPFSKGRLWPQHSWQQNLSLFTESMPSPSFGERHFSTFIPFLLPMLMWSPLCFSAADCSGEMEWTCWWNDILFSLSWSRLNSFRKIFKSRTQASP